MTRNVAKIPRAGCFTPRIIPQAQKAADEDRARRFVTKPAYHRTVRAGVPHTALRKKYGEQRVSASCNYVLRALPEFNQSPSTQGSVNEQNRLPDGEDRDVSFPASPITGRDQRSPSAVNRQITNLRHQSEPETRRNPMPDNF